jgi:hypothetical protein
MADVFISYAKADRSPALKLAAMLEAGRCGGTQVSPNTQRNSRTVAAVSGYRTGTSLVQKMRKLGGVGTKQTLTLSAEAEGTCRQSRA